MWSRLLLINALLTCTWAWGQNTANEEASPFSAPRRSSPATPSDAPLQFAGVVSSRQGTSVNILDRGSGHSHWIEIGKTAGGIEVISFDAKADAVTVRHGGQTHTLSLKGYAFGSPTTDFTSLGVIPLGIPNPKSPAAVAAQEREARMLVSDLLDMSWQQRKGSSRKQ